MTVLEYALTNYIRELRELEFIHRNDLELCEDYACRRAELEKRLADWIIELREKSEVLH